MSEIWKDVVGYEGLYEVSNIGNVRSVAHDVVLGGQRAGVIHHVRAKMRKLQRRYDGYVGIKLIRDSVLSDFLVHRLVASAFIENAKNLPEVNHKNSDRTDNRVENLEWVTAKDNVAHSTREGSAHGERKGCSKLKDDDIIDIKFLLSYGVTNADIGRLYGVKPHTISVIKHGKTWKRAA